MNLDDVDVDFRISEKDFKKITRFSKKKGISISETIRRILNEKL